VAAPSGRASELGSRPIKTIPAKMSLSTNQLAALPPRREGERQCLKLQAWNVEQSQAIAAWFQTTTT